MCSAKFHIKGKREKISAYFCFANIVVSVVVFACISSKLFHVFSSAKHFLIRKQFRALLECLKFTKQLRAHFLWVNGCDAISKLWRECGIKFQIVNSSTLICRLPSSTQNTRVKFWHSKARFWFSRHKTFFLISPRKAHTCIVCVWRRCTSFKCSRFH